MEDRAAMGLKRGGDQSGPSSKKQRRNSLEPAARSDEERMQQVEDSNTDEPSELRSAKALNSDGKQTLVVALLAVLSLLIFIYSILLSHFRTFNHSFASMVVPRVVVVRPARAIGQPFQLVSKQQTDETEDKSERRGDFLADPAEGETQRGEPAALPKPSYQDLLRMIADKDRVIDKEKQVNAVLKDRLIEKLMEPSPAITTETPTDGKRTDDGC